VAVFIYYLNTYDEEKGCIEKFGEEYKRCMERVPRMNFVLEIIRARRRSRG
jgi:protein-S-isoprenylcysteine O-methyltransferase Ste14